MLVFSFLFLIYVSIYLSVCLSIYIYLSLGLCVWQFAHVPVWLSTSLPAWPSTVYLSVWQSIKLSEYLSSACLPICLSEIYLISICLCLPDYLSACLSDCPSVCLPVCPAVCLSLCVPDDLLTDCLPVYLSNALHTTAARQIVATVPPDSSTRAALASLPFGWSGCKNTPLHALSIFHGHTSLASDWWWLPAVHAVGSLTSQLPFMKVPQYSTIKNTTLVQPTIKSMRFCLGQHQGIVAKLCNHWKEKLVNVQKKL
jgi:hypothetical protein